MSYNYQDAPRESQQEYFGKVHTDNKETLQNALKRIEELEKENATLKKQLGALSGDIPWNELKDVSEVIKKLTEVKEILQTVFDKWEEISLKPVRVQSTKGAKVIMSGTICMT